MKEHNVDVGTIPDNYAVTAIDEAEADDLYLTSAGFEERTLTATDSLDSEYRANWGIIYVNSEYFDLPKKGKTKEHVEALQDRLEEHCENVDVIMGSWLDAAKQLYQLREGFSVLSERDSLRLTVDVTSFNRESMMVAFNILYSLSNDITTQILYVSPEEYGEWLSKGYRMVRNVMGFAGIQNSNKPTLLMVLSGFEESRAINTIEAVEPAKLLVGTGDPAIKEPFLEKNIEHQDLAYSRLDTEEFRFPADSINGSYLRITELLEDYSGDYNVIVSPMNTKLSTLGVWNAAREFQEAQVIYTIPSRYNFENYSSGSDTLYVDWM